jgi:glycogen synthase
VEPTPVSIVVSTYNRAASLERLLRSLPHLDYRPFEVVVVNGPSTDETETLLAGHAGRVKVASCPNPNLSMSRNIGIARAAGDVVVFIDDDALPAGRAWLSSLVEPFTLDRGGTVGATGGPTLHRDTDWYEFSEGFTSDYAEQVFVGSHDDGQPARAAGRWFRRTVGNNCAFLRSALIEIGGFDEHFEYYLDETDVCLRLARAGYRVVSTPRAAVRHYPAPSPHGAPFIRNRRIITRSDAYFCLKNGADPMPLRLLRTLRAAPRKHFVREMSTLKAQGTISAAAFRRFWVGWAFGLLQGLWRGLATRRRTPLRPGGDENLSTFVAPARERPLSIALLSRGIPPETRGGGVGRYTYDLARGLHELGHRVTVVTESPVALRHEALDFAIAGVTPVVLPQTGLRHLPVLSGNLAYAQGVLDFVRSRTGEDSFDVIHASSWGLEGLGVALWGRVPLVLLLVTPLERVMEAEGWKRTEDLAANIVLDQWVVEHAARVCAPSNGVLQTYQARGVASAPPAVHVVPLGIAPGNGQASLRPTRRRRVLFVGRLERRKGIETLLEALPGVLSRHPDWECDLVGDRSVPAGPGETFEQRFTARHAGAPWLPRVRFRGVVDDRDLQDYYAGADLFVAPSLYESFGLIYLEAMQYGVPVIGCRTGGVPDVVMDGDHGLLVPPGDAVALEAALDRLMEDDELRRRLGANGATRVRGEMTHRALAERMVIQYRETVTRVVASAAAQGSERADVVPAVLEVLESNEATTGIGLAIQATAAFEDRNLDLASHLIAQALGVVQHPGFVAMAVELALEKGDRRQALALSTEGFAACCDGDPARLVFAAVIDRAVSAAESAAPAPGFEAWRGGVDGAIAEQWFRTGIDAVRVGRHASAQILMERALAADRRSRARWRDEARYHLASIHKRRGDTQTALRMLDDLAGDGGLARLPTPVEAAACFHRGELELARGDLAAARRDLARCLLLNPEHRRARQLLSSAGPGSRETGEPPSDGPSAQAQRGAAV